MHDLNIRDSLFRRSQNYFVKFPFHEYWIFFPRNGEFSSTSSINVQFLLTHISFRGILFAYRFQMRTFISFVFKFDMLLLRSYSFSVNPKRYFHDTIIISESINATECLRTNYTPTHNSISEPVLIEIAYIY